VLYFAALHYKRFVFYASPSLAIYLAYKLKIWLTSNIAEGTAVDLILRDSYILYGRDTDEGEGDVLKLSFYLGGMAAAEFRPGKWISLNIPSLDGSWHPFSPIFEAVEEACHGESSNAVFDETRMCVYIKKKKNWTKGVLEKMACSFERKGSIVRGYRHVMLISGGLGITLHLSILHDIIRWQEKGGLEEGGIIKSVHLVWSVRQPALLHHFEKLLRGISTALPQLKVSIYHTGSAVVPAISVDSNSAVCDNKGPAVEVREDVSHSLGDPLCTKKKNESSSQHGLLYDGCVYVGFTVGLWYSHLLDWSGQKSAWLTTEKESTVLASAIFGATMMAFFVRVVLPVFCNRMSVIVQSSMGHKQDQNEDVQSQEESLNRFVVVARLLDGRQKKVSSSRSSITTKTKRRHVEPTQSLLMHTETTSSTYVTPSNADIEAGTPTSTST